MRGAETAMATLLCDDYDIICLRRGKKAVKREKRGVLQRQHRVMHVRLPTLCYIFVQRIQCDPENRWQILPIVFFLHPCPKAKKSLI